MRRPNTYTPAPPLSAAELTGRIDRLRQQLRIANGEWADRIEDDIETFERMQRNMLAPRVDGSVR